MSKRTLVIALITLAMALPAGAQTFGRNKVHYDRFDFQVLETPHFDIYYYPAERDASLQAGRLAERWYDRLSVVLNHTFKDRQPILLYGSHPKFRQTNVIRGFLGDGVGGITDHAKGRVVLPFTASLGETDHVLGHELVHAFQRDILRRNGGSIGSLPLWFAEGMAEYLSVGQIDANTSMWLRDAVEQNRLPRIDQLDDPRWFPYRYGQALWAYLAGRFGDDVVATSLKAKVSGKAVKRLVAVTGVDAATLSSAWHESIRQSVARADITPVETSATSVLASRNGAGRLNVGPALSPDGTSIVFFSDRDRYSIDVVLADTASGAIRRKIVRTAGDPHFESLQFIESAGSWEPAGRRFALAALSGGQPVLTILDTLTGDIERELPIRDVDQIFSPTWSPDSRQIAFSALRNGFSDLYVLDLDTASVRALTSDPYADLQPSWSPDGRTIAFTTDRFTSSIETLTFGKFQLGLLDVGLGTIREVGGIPGAKNIDPHWSAEGESLYFIADDQQTSNVYRVVLADGRLFQVTDVATGVSGVTALSPALTVAGRSNQLAFSVYRQGKYEIRLMDASVGKTVPVAAPAAADASKLIPVTPKAAEPVPTRLASAAVTLPTFGLPDGSQFTSRRYRHGLSLSRIAQPYVTAGGGGGGGSFLRAGVGFTFGDMLGDHELQTAIQVGKRATDFVAQVAYLNLASRWNWAVAGSQVPWLTGSTRSAGNLGNGGTMTREIDLFQQVHREISGVVIYPFNRSKRLELSGGLQSVAFGRQTTTSVYSTLNGQLVNETTATNTAEPSALLVESGAALVYDSAVFGPTSPILGQRYRFAVHPTFGRLTFTSVTADYRRYVMPLRPFTIAMRVMHMGRYGQSADDPRLLPLVWTLRDIVRGYGDSGAVVKPAGDLRESRMFVGNVELRFPLAAVIRRSSDPGQMPIEGLLFSDAATFWMPTTVDRHSTTLRSVGAGVRINAAGFVFEFDAVRPFDLPSQGWTFSVNFRPGF